MGHLYRADLWRDAEYRCEVLGGIALHCIVLTDQCEELAVSLYPCGGFASLSFAHAAAEEHNGDG